MTEERVDSKDRYNVKVKIGEKEYEVKYVPQCKVCNHAGRFKIEEMLLLGKPFTKIKEWTSETKQQQEDGSYNEWYEISYSSIRNHFAYGHSSLEASLLNELQERRAAALGINLEEQTSEIVDAIIVQQVIMHKGFEAIIKGEQVPDVKDTLTASKFVQDYERATTQDTTQAEWQEAMIVMLATAKAILDPPQWMEFIKTISNNPVMKQLEGRKTADDD